MSGKNIKPALPYPAAHAIELLNQAGFEAFAVGGCVRDTLLEKTPDDWDITTSAVPEQTAAVFSAYPTIETGVKHGTLTAVIEGMPLEITTYRIDGAYSDGRRPDTVAFSQSLQEDLRRRDFTVNAMAYHPALGFVDYFGGRSDLKAGVLRCVGSPEKRFDEDALRIMRALRFSSVLQFSIEADTAAAIHAQAERLSLVAKERLFIEFKKLIAGQGAAHVLPAYRDVLGVLFPALSLCPAQAYAFAAGMLSALPTDPAIRTAALLGCLDREESVRESLNRLRPDKAFYETVMTLWNSRNLNWEMTDVFLLRLLLRLGPVHAGQLLQIKKAEALTRSMSPAVYDAISRQLNKLLDEGACYSLQQLAVTGSDLMAVGVMPGKAMGQMLNHLLEAVIDGRCPNERQALLTLAAAALTQK